MLSSEKSLVSPWPTLSSLSLSTWPTPAPGVSSDEALTSKKKSWNENTNITTSKDVSPSFLTFGDLNSFSFDDLGSCSPCDLKLDNIDSLAAKLLSLSAAGEGQELQQEEAEMKRPVTTPSPSTSESEININVAASSSNSRSTPDNLSGDKSDEDNSEGDQNTRFKTEICRNFKEKGHCLYGDLCQFAHGKDEMRNVGQHSKYKTKRCQKYWIAGYCAYGPRCNFLHYEEKDQVQPKHSSGPMSGRLARPGGEVNLDSGYTTPSMSPPALSLKLPSTPVPLDTLFRPVHGSGRLAAVSKEGEFFWIDTRTQKYV